MACDNESCRECAVVNGTGREQRVIERCTIQEEPMETRFYPDFVAPSPDLFEIPERCPSLVRLIVQRAFTFSWRDYDICANLIRTALEAVLTERRVPKTGTDRRGRRVRLTLHSRIEKFAAANPARRIPLSKLMKAVKWLGNWGSHDGGEDRELKQSDVFDAFDLLEYVLVELYERRSERLWQLAQNINKNKGPARKGR
jgi:hypothetical protein